MIRQIKRMMMDLQGLPLGDVILRGEQFFVILKKAIVVGFQECRNNGFVVCEKLLFKLRRARDK